MAKNAKAGLEIFENPEALQEQLTKTEQYAKTNQKLVVGAGAALVLLVAGFIGLNFYNQSQNQKAQEELFPAVFYFEKDSLNRAVKGDNGNTTIGLEKIADDYGSTEAGNLAQFYLGVAKLKQGKYDEAIQHLEDFEADDLLVQARTYSLLGDAYMEKNDIDKAIGFYKKAADYYPNEAYTPTYLMKLGLAYELKKEWAQAALAYRTIANDFKEATELALAQKKLARVEYIVNNGKK